MEDDGEESEEDNHSRPPSRSWLRRLAARLFGAGEGGEGEPWRRRVRLKRLAGLLLFAYALARMLRSRRPPVVPMERALYSVCPRRRAPAAAAPAGVAGVAG